MFAATALPLVPPDRDRSRRQARRLRAETREKTARQEAPGLHTDRMRAVSRLLWAYRERDYPPGVSPLADHLGALEVEVEGLESWAVKRSRAQREDGPTTRRALAFLRAYGRLTSLDYSVVPTEERPLLVRLLALEHRWCYAAAGTTRDDFKDSIGRTGAR